LTLETRKVHVQSQVRW